MTGATNKAKKIIPPSQQTRLSKYRKSVIAISIGPGHERIQLRYTLGTPESGRRLENPLSTLCQAESCDSPNCQHRKTTSLFSSLGKSTSPRSMSFRKQPYS